MKKIGKRVKVRLSCQTADGNLLVLAGQRDATLNITIATIDTSSKDTGEWATSLGGEKSWEVSVSGAFVFGDTSLQMIRDAVLKDGGGGFYIELFDDEGVVEAGDVILSSYNRSFPNSEVITYDCSFTGNGKLSAVAGVAFGDLMPFKNKEEVKEVLTKAAGK